MPWNLVDALAVQGQRRPFFLPLAAIPPGGNSVRAVDLDQFALDDDTSDQDDPFLRIDIVPIGGSEGTLPDPAVRLHAMAPGTLRFVPAQGGVSDRLILRMCLFAEPIDVGWWPQWVRSGHMPLEVIYDNVDALVFLSMLWQTTDLTLVGTPGLSLPADVTDKAVFLTKFFDGEAGYELSAVAGAVMGVAGDHPTTSSLRRLNLHVRYNTHTTAAPRPMNPREFFYLLFGDDSAESAATTGHPFLLQMRQRGANQTGMVTRTMHLRPPLHTSRRVEWEADQEIQNFHTAWRRDHELGTARLFNTHSRNNMAFDRGDYLGWDKCNVFAFDICLRAGFRVVIHDAGTSWHYIDANSTCNRARLGRGTAERNPLLGLAADNQVRWGWNVDGWIAASANRQASVNDAINNEGRCFLMTAGRGRRFESTKCGPNATGICDCSSSLKTTSGHSVIMREVLNEPTVTEGVVTRIRAATLQSGPKSGASRQNWMFSVGAVLAEAGGPTPFVCVQVVELQPGGDPGTSWGLRDLNVQAENSFAIALAAARATDRRMTHDAAGNLLPPTVHNCCHDDWPNSNTVSVVSC